MNTFARTASMTRGRAWAIWAALALAAALVLVAALTLGSVPIPPRQALGALFTPAGGDPLAGEIVRTLRLPRALAGFGCGGLLALAGALLQVLLRNPLAEPYVLGASRAARPGSRWRP